MTQCDWTSFLS